MDVSCSRKFQLRHFGLFGPMKCHTGPLFVAELNRHFAQHWVLLDLYNILTGSCKVYCNIIWRFLILQNLHSELETISFFL